MLNKWSVLFIILLSIIPAIADTQFYCLNNSTLRKETLKNVTIDTTTKQLTVVENINCRYGCFNDTITGASCGKSEEVNTGLYVAIAIVMIVVIIFVYNLIRRL